MDGETRPARDATLTWAIRCRRQGLATHEWAASDGTGLHRKNLAAPDRASRRRAKRHSTYFRRPERFEPGRLHAITEKPPIRCALASDSPVTRLQEHGTMRFLGRESDPIGSPSSTQMALPNEPSPSHVFRTSHDATSVSSARYAALTVLELADLLVIASAFSASVVLAHGPAAQRHVLEIAIQVQHIVFVAAFLAYCHVAARALGLYSSYRLSSVLREIRDLVRLVFVAVLPVYLAGRWLGFDYATAPFVPRFALLMFVGLALERRVVRLLARSVRRHGRNLRNAIVVGRAASGLELASRLMRGSDLGYLVAEVVDVSANGEASALERVTEILDTRPIDEVFVSLALDRDQALIRAIIALCEEQGVTIRLLSNVVDLFLARARMDEIDGRPVLSIFSGPPDSVMLGIKRLLDIVVALTALLLLAPLLAVLALLIKRDSPGPVIFAQERVGLGGRRFRCYKLRTMVCDAEQRQAELEHLNEATGAVFKIKDDPRITRVGRFLRRQSLDELPQLVNVLKGDMSLVGPRPLPVRDVLRFGERGARRRFSVKPGITCLWQVHRREPDFAEWIKSDMEYIDNWSLQLDLQILVKTIPAVLTGRAAY